MELVVGEPSAQGTEKMRSLDLYMEKQLCDRGMDNAASRAFSREVDEINKQARLEQEKTLSGRDKLALASTSIALGSPFMLFGLGTTFAILDEFDYLRRSRSPEELQNRRLRELNVRRGFVPPKEEEQRKLRPDMLPCALMSAEMQVGQPAKKKRSPLRRTEQAVFSASRDNRPFLAAGKSWLEASRLVKKKQMLLDLMERLRGQQSLSAVSKLLSKIELLDKVLKRLGC